MLLNLAINSLQALAKGGQIVFSTSLRDEWCFVKVADSGGGVNEGIVAKVFDPFSRPRKRVSGLACRSRIRSLWGIVES